MLRILPHLGTTLLTSTLLVSLAACGGESEATETDQGGAVTQKGAGEHEEHAGHDHDGAGHGDEEHAGHDHDGHDHDGDEGGHSQAGQHVASADDEGGMGITLSEFTPISTLLATPAEFEGKRVLVKGKALEACKMRGCWVELESDKDFETLRVKVNDGEIVFPQECIGTEVVVEGTLQKLDLTLEQARAWAKHKAEEQGQEFDPASVTEATSFYQLRGLGAKIGS